MHISNRHLLRQGPVLAALGRTALLALRQQVLDPAPQAVPVPGPLLRRSCPPLPRALVADYIRHVGGDPRAYRGLLPAHLFPQWTMPLLARTLEGLPYPLLRVVNGGCSVEVRAQLPDDEPLEVSARLVSIDDDGRRAVLKQQVTTGTRSQPEALAIDFYAIVPLPKGAGGQARPQRAGASRAIDGGSGREHRKHVPLSARELAFYRLTEADALGYAKLTGDFNPIHWVPAYARASGFGNVILHGFASLALAWEGLTKSLFGGDIDALARFDVKLLKPLLLPHRVGLFREGDEAFIANGPGGPAYLSGRFQTRGTR